MNEYDSEVAHPGHGINAPKNTTFRAIWQFAIDKPGGTQPTHRLTKGQKANKKRMVTAATVFTRAPWVRTPPQIIESLFPTNPRADRDAPAPPRPENKRVWASLLKGKTAVIQEVAEEMDRRDQFRSLTRLALTDGERALQIRVDRKLNVTLILDLMQVLEKLWKAAYVFHAEGSLAADLWVMHHALRILFGEVGQVVKGSVKASPNAPSPAPNAQR